MGPCYSVKAAYSDQRCPDRRETCKCKQNNSRPSPIPYTIRDSWSDVCGEAHSTGLFRLTVLTYARMQWSVAVSLRMIHSQQAPVFVSEFHYSVSFFLRACNSSALLTPRAESELYPSSKQEQSNKLKAINTFILRTSTRETDAFLSESLIDIDAIITTWDVGIWETKIRHVWILRVWLVSPQTVQGLFSGKLCCSFLASILFSIFPNIFTSLFTLLKWL